MNMFLVMSALFVHPSTQQGMTSVERIILTIICDYERHMFLSTAAVVAEYSFPSLKLV
jgi:hypothetical protein